MVRLETVNDEAFCTKRLAVFGLASEEDPASPCVEITRFEIEGPTPVKITAQLVGLLDLSTVPAPEPETGVLNATALACR